MTTTSVQPESTAFLHAFVQDCTEPGQISTLNGPYTGVTSEIHLANVQRLPVMFRCVLPQNNQSRHALIYIRPEITPIERDFVIEQAFSIRNNINGARAKIQTFRPVWADGHTPPAANIDTFEKASRIMGTQMNGFMEVIAEPLKCDFCVENDYAKLSPRGFPTLGIRPVCETCWTTYWEPTVA